MDPLIIILIIVIIAVVAFFVWRFLKQSRDPEYAAQMSKKRAAKDIERQQRKLERAEQRALRARYEEAIAPAKADLLKAKQDYNSRIKRREDDLNKLQREHDRAIRDQEKAITEIEKRYSQHLITVNGIKLFADRISTREATVAINNTFFAEIKTGEELLNFGGKYSAFTIEQPVEGGEPPLSGGTALGGIGVPEFPWRIIVNPEASYLFIMGTVVESGNEQFNMCVVLDARNRDDAAKLMEMLNQTSEKADTIERRKIKEIEDARNQLEQMKADTSALEEAEEALHREREDNAAVEDAQARYEEAQRQAQEETGYVPKSRGNR